MRTKRILSMLLSFIMILGSALTPVFAENTETITAFVNLTQYGEIQKDKSDNPMALAQVELPAGEACTLDDLFKALHDACYEGGSDAGYASDVGEWGLYITKFWGDESGNYGYQVNGGAETVMGLSHEIKNGDFVDVAIYRNTYPDTESYTKFDKYSAEVYVNEQTELTLSRAGYDENWNTVFSPCEDAVITVNGEDKEITTDADGKAVLSFDTAGTYIVSAGKTKTVGDETVPDITAPVCVVTVKDFPDTCITVPKDAELFVGAKGRTHFVSFTEHEPVYTASDEENTKYYFELDDNSTYNYRVSGENYVTYGGTFKKTPDFSLSITDEQLKPAGKSKNTVDRDSSSNNGHNTADIYLNINPQGHLKLSEGDTFQIVSLRNWEAVNNTSSNYFIEPDYHYEVTDENGNASDVVEISENGVLKALKSGTAIVLVTYDAMTLNFGGGDDFYGAIHPENTGVFVVSVDEVSSETETGMTVNEGKNTTGIKLSGDNIDSEHDCIYYTGEQGEFTFMPKTDGVCVYVANPAVDTKTVYNGFKEVTANSDKSFSVPLKTGRNIIKLEKDGNAQYQIITAKQVNVTVNSGEEVHKGDTLSIVFDTLYHPANKLAGVYNMNAIAVYTDVSGYDGQIIGAASAQYNFANNSSAQTVANILTEKNVWGVVNYEKSGDLIIPEDYPYDVFVLSGGAIYTSGWGDSYGNHRAITYENGKGANLNADAKLGYLGKLPDIEIPVVATTSALASVTLNTDNVKTDYFAGDKFDTTGLVVTASYEDGATQIATNYTVSPEILSAGTDKVVVTYRGKTAEIPVSVTNPKVKAIEIKNAPAKTKYKEGETFNPSGMLVTAVYENGAKAETTQYSYSPNRELETSDAEMIISYTGENGTNTIEPVSQPITVTKKTASSGSVSTSDTITVYFTLLGDEKHGTPSGSSDTHTKKKGNLDTWISKTKITLDKGSFVIDAVKKALSLKGIPYTSDDNYISEIKGLVEFDNGSLSGWMYTLNGKYSSKGVGEQKLSDSDAIIFHYTDDYTAEKTSYSSGSASSSSKSKNNSSTKEETAKTDDTANYLITTVNNPTVSSVGGEWTIIGLARSGAEVPDDYYSKYYSNVLSYVRSKDGNLHSRKYTEYSRVILALTAIGKNPEDVEGYNLVAPVMDYDKTVQQGINGSIWAIIALDSGDYGSEEIINKYIAHILEREKKNGGWALSDAELNAEADITAMALIALSRYKDRQDVSMAINRGISVLSEMQNKNGGYTAYNTEASESTAQVLTALSALGISYNDSRFVKNGKTLIDNILSFKQPDGSFSHTDESNLMATEQCYYSLVAAKRLEENKTPLFDMSDTESTSTDSIGLEGKNADVNVPGIINVNKTFSDIAAHKNQTAVEMLAQRGIINGMSENIFAPDNTMTRAEFACITVRALGLPVKDNAVFEDVSKDSWYSQYVNTAYAYGIVNGVSKTKFNPDGTITFEQACAMISRAAELCGMKNDLDDASIRNILAEFTDYMTVSEWAKASVAFCFDKSISDRSVMAIEPTKAVTRGQMADMVFKLLKGARLI